MCSWLSKDSSRFLSFGCIHISWKATDNIEAPHLSILLSRTPVNASVVSINVSD